MMKKIITTTVIAMMALAGSLANPVLAGTTFLSPVSYSEWRQAGNVFPGGFQYYACYYLKLSPESRKIMAERTKKGEAYIYDRIETFGEFTVNDLRDYCLPLYDSTNRDWNSYRIVPQ